MVRRRRFVRRRNVRRRRTVRRRRSSRPVKSLFRSRGRIRRSNTGGFNVNNIMRTGNSLPQTAFGSCKLVVAAQQHYLGGAIDAYMGSGYAAGGRYNDGRRTICLSTLQYPYAWYQDSSLLQYIRAYGLYRLLYKKYMVLGAKVKIRLTPGLFPLRNTQNPDDGYSSSIPAQPKFTENAVDNPSTWDQVINNAATFATARTTLDSSPNGYFYIRVCVQRFNENGFAVPDPFVDIGHRMLWTDGAGPTTRIVPYGEVDTVPWQSLPDFLGDRTVAYSRDRRSWQVGLQDTPAVIGANTFASMVTQSRFVSTNVSGKRPATVLTYKYSLKKLMKDSDPMRSGSPFWRSIDAAPLSSTNNTLSSLMLNFPRQDVFLRYGYVWFDPVTGDPQYHYQLPIPFAAQTEIDYYCAWRDPVDIHDLNDPVLSAMNKGVPDHLLKLSTLLRTKTRKSQDYVALLDELEETVPDDIVAEGISDGVPEEVYPESIAESDQDLAEPLLKRSRVSPELS